MGKLLWLLMLAAACAAAQTVQGSVFDAATGAGAAGVKVELIKGGTPFYEATTDGGGRFRFDNIREGDYAVRYQSPDYWQTAGFADYRYFHVGVGDDVKVETKMMPWSKISGRVVDGSGNGVPNARLELSGSQMLANGRTFSRTSWGGGGGGALSDVAMSMAHSGNTDAHGDFQVLVMPGSFMLCATPPKDLKPPAERGWKRTCYPDEASRIPVLPATEIAGIELKLRAVPVHTLRGVILNPDGTPAPKVEVKVGDGMLATSELSKADGTFELSGVTEGEWRVHAEVGTLRATEWPEVKGHDVENLKLRLEAPLTIRGKVIVEAPKEAPPLGPRPMILSMRRGRTLEETLAPGTTALMNPNASGDLMVEAYPGVYRLATMLQPPPAPYYLDAMRLGEADLAKREVEISSDAVITIVYKADGGTVSGRAEKCFSGGVLLVPRDPEQRGPGFSKSGACDANDHYEVRAVRPGDYYALAFAGNGPVVPIDDALLSQAVKITVRSGEASAADLKAVTRPVFDQQ